MNRSRQCGETRQIKTRPASEAAPGSRRAIAGQSPGSRREGGVRARFAAGGDTRGGNTRGGNTRDGTLRRQRFFENFRNTSSPFI